MIKDELIEYIQNYCTNEELVPTTISSLVFYTTKQKSEFKSIIYEPSLCIALQGGKSSWIWR